MPEPTGLNPFSTRYVKPGALPFRLEAPETLDSLVDRLEKHNWRGEITGPHGVGKSTLVQNLLTRALPEATTVIIRSGDSPRQQYAEVLRELTSVPGGNRPEMLIIDGLEQLSGRQQKQILDRTAKLGVGMLATCHQSVGLPRLIDLKPRLDTFRQIVSDLMRNRPIQLKGEEIDRVYHQYQPNLREALFSLYDLYEIKSRN